MVASVRNKSITHARDVREHFKPAGDEIQSFVVSAVRPHSAKFAKIGAKLPVFSWHCAVMKADQPEVFPRNPFSARFSPEKQRPSPYSSIKLPARVPVASLRLPVTGPLVLLPQFDHIQSPIRPVAHATQSCPALRSSHGRVSRSFCHRSGHQMFQISVIFSVYSGCVPQIPTTIGSRQPWPPIIPKPPESAVFRS